MHCENTVDIAKVVYKNLISTNIESNWKYFSKRLQPLS